MNRPAQVPSYMPHTHTAAPRFSASTNLLSRFQHHDATASGELATLYSAFPRVRIRAKCSTMMMTKPTRCCLRTFTQLHQRSSSRSHLAGSAPCPVRHLPPRNRRSPFPLSVSRFPSTNTCLLMVGRQCKYVAAFRCRRLCFVYGSSRVALLVSRPSLRMYLPPHCVF